MSGCHVKILLRKWIRPQLWREGSRPLDGPTTCSSSSGGSMAAMKGGNLTSGMVKNKTYEEVFTGNFSVSPGILFILNLISSNWFVLDRWNNSLKFESFKLERWKFENLIFENLIYENLIFEILIFETFKL
jgi:hypothetical protein